jgi:hypothetical protein
VRSSEPGGLLNPLEKPLSKPIQVAVRAGEKDKAKKRQEMLNFGLTRPSRAPIYRAHAARKALTLRAVLYLWHDENSRLEALFDIVIRGRGTWAAALFAIPVARPVMNRALLSFAFFSLQRVNASRFSRIETQIPRQTNNAFEAKLRIKT